MNAIAKAVSIAGGPSKVAGLLGISAQAVCFYRDGKRRMPVEYCSTLERAYGVPRWEFRPDDWHRIWPELVGASGAPEPPKQEARDPSADPAVWPLSTDRRTEPRGINTEKEAASAA